MKEFLDKEQLKNFNNWNKERKEVCKLTYTGAIGGRLTYSFTPTGLGTVVKVKCACGEEIDLTDYNW